MVKKIALYACAAVCVVSLSGCVALLAGAGGAAGTAVWLSGKLTQEFNAPYSRSIEAVEEALASLDYAVSKKTVKSTVAQVMSNHADGRTIWIDIRPVGSQRTRIDARVGMVSDEIAARELMDAIEHVLLQ
ncbi:MAG: DUF3568 domain-containing protein [Candidatus Omnitrophica bacterium]|nr:DUF3568 domain-containing protein [Candidatus Omnitrophota bacterium]